MVDKNNDFSKDKREKQLEKTPQYKLAEAQKYRANICIELAQAKVKLAQVKAFF